jgi:hypothetical protein
VGISGFSGAGNSGLGPTPMVTGVLVGSAHEDRIAAAMINEANRMSFIAYTRDAEITMSKHSTCLGLPNYSSA